jgi:hypothetical protein
LLQHRDHLGLSVAIGPAQDPDQLAQSAILEIGLRKLSPSTSKRLKESGSIYPGALVPNYGKPSFAREEIPSSSKRAAGRPWIADQPLSPPCLSSLTRQLPAEMFSALHRKNSW